MGQDIDGRQISRTVLAGMAEQWRDMWDTIAHVQARNPDVRATATAEGDADPVEGSVPILVAMAGRFHPQAVAAGRAFCDAVATELGYGEAVAGVCEPVFVENSGGDGQQDDQAVTLQDRVDELEDENRALRVEVEHTRRVLRAVRDVVDQSMSES